MITGTIAVVVEHVLGWSPLPPPHLGSLVRMIHDAGQLLHVVIEHVLAGVARLVEARRAPLLEHYKGLTVLSSCDVLSSLRCGQAFRCGQKPQEGVEPRGRWSPCMRCLMACITQASNIKVRVIE